MIDKPTCSSCKFYRADEKTCMRFPPTLIVLPDGLIAMFPQVNADVVWCGEYVKKVILQ